MPAAQRATRATAPGTILFSIAPPVNGTLKFGTNTINAFDPTQLPQNSTVSIPDGYGNAGGSDNVPVDNNKIEFGFQNKNSTSGAAFVVSVDITNIASGCLVSWAEVIQPPGGVPGGPVGGGIISPNQTVTLSSDAFINCTNILQLNNTFSQSTGSLVGNTITLTTPGFEVNVNTTFQATWQVDCPQQLQVWIGTKFRLNATVAATVTVCSHRLLKWIIDAHSKEFIECGVP